MKITNVGSFLEWASSYFAKHKLFYGHGTDNPWDEAVMLVLYLLKLPANTDKSALDLKLSDTQRDQLVNLAHRRVKERIPVPYLTNEAWFMGERYIVNKNVIIPRSPVAELISAGFQPWLGKVKPERILDLCTGSGCLAIACAKEFPQAQVDAVDISPQALEVAVENIKLHNCEDRVHLIQSDLFQNLKGRKYDIILSNPPYVSAKEMRALPKEYTFEPELALASGVDGLDITIKILQQAKDYLNADGILCVELGNSWQTLANKYHTVAFNWLEFANGGEGVFILKASDLN